MGKGKKRKRMDIDRELLETIVELEKEWKQIRMIMNKSIESSQVVGMHLALAEAKYMFAFREARRRNLRAIR
ncbi:DUF2508 family protein [Oceanobacillus piezotolerans]|uniref:DUF2508 family protein n=1 Tax=Oceanobacillus piezotolerans TaxID=2448030 RepID=A0A498DEA0_9BACI|nr:YaaL family protein [Oceanobacillus piezotolerans]RLL41709.1 DUF2508 family protein [Oceanobacillus piezotolerans]